jgi:hypothetical protein
MKVILLNYVYFNTSFFLFFRLFTFSFVFDYLDYSYSDTMYRTSPFYYIQFRMPSDVNFAINSRKVFYFFYN